MPLCLAQLTALHQSMGPVPDRAPQGAHSLDAVVFLPDIDLHAVDVENDGEPPSNVVGLADQLEHGKCPVAAGVDEVERWASSSEPPGIEWPKALQASHLSSITGYMRTCLNPGSLSRNPAFSQAIVVRSPSATVYVGGQNAVTASGEIVGETLYEQTRQALRNVDAALAAADASIDDLVRWTIAIVDGQSIQEGFAALVDAYGQMTDPPTIGVHVVSGLANPRFLVEIDAVAVT